MGVLMGVWVVPAIAATLWGVSEEDVCRQVADGRLLSRQELGFTLVYTGPAEGADLAQRVPTAEAQPTTWTPAEVIDAVPPAGSYPIQAARRNIGAFRHPPSARKAA
ncbi:MAG: hypothetical protein ACFCVE_10115 [Phycisphaerae bacterium]